MNKPDADVLTTAEAAELLRVSEPTMRKLAAQLGRRVGKDWRYSRAALLRWLEAPAVEADQERQQRAQQRALQSLQMPPPANASEALSRYLGGGTQRARGRRGRMRKGK